MNYGTPTPKRPADARCVATYDYHDERGVYLATKRRFEKDFEKWFDWIRKPKDPGVPSLPGAGDQQLPLYLAHELVRAEPFTLYFCEGEKDADRLRSLGLLATSTPYGALVGAKRWDPRWTQTIRRFERITILEDNDDQGREHAARVAAALRSLIPSVRVLSLPNLPDHGDVSDWLDQGHKVEELLEAAESATEWSPPEWPEPIPLTDVRGLPDFPTAYFHGWLGDFIEAVGREMLTPTAAPALLALCAVSATVMRKVAVHVKDNWTEPLNLYTVVVLPSGDLKSPIFRIVCAPIEAWERSEASRLKKAIDEAANKQANLRARLEGTRKKAGRAKEESERRELESVADKLSKQLAEMILPKAPRLLATDVTEESAGYLLQEYEGRLAIMSDEGGPFRNMQGRHTTNKAAFFEVFKHSHNGARLLVDRMSRPRIDVSLAAIALGLMVQPSVLRSLRDTPELRGEGFLARPLYAVPTVPDRDWNDAIGVPYHIAEGYNRNMRALLDLPPGSDDRGAPAPHIMELSPEALSLVVPFRNEMEARIRSGGDLSHISDWGKKLTGQAIRVAALIHLADLAGKLEPWRKPVPASALERAFAFAREFLIPHALGAFSLIGSAPESSLAEEVLAWIRRRGVGSFKKRDLHDHLRSHVEKPEDWDRPLHLLEELGWIRQVMPEPKKKGRPSVVFDVNPRLLDRTPAPENPPDHGDAWEGPDNG